MLQGDGNRKGSSHLGSCHVSDWSKRSVSPLTATLQYVHAQTRQHPLGQQLNDSNQPQQLLAAACTSAAMSLSSVSLIGAGMRTGFTGPPAEPGSSAAQVAAPSATTCSLLLDTRTTRSLNCTQTTQRDGAKVSTLHVVCAALGPTPPVRLCLQARIQACRRCV